MSTTTATTKTLKTYSKHQRIVNCENLFQNIASTEEPISSTNSSNEPARLEEAKQEIKTKRGRKPAAVKVQDVATKPRNTSQRTKAASTKELEVACTTSKSTKKRQVSSNYATTQNEVKKRSKKVEENKENSQQQVKPNEPIKLFEMSEDSNSSSGRSVPNPVKKETKTKAKPEKKLSVSASATQIVDSMASAWNMTHEKKSNCTLKSILRPNTHVTNEKETEQQQVVKKPKSKRVVKILAEITCKDDNLTTLKCDNRKKHAASTSTPTGTRRKPLKAPQNVSIICKK